MKNSLNLLLLVFAILFVSSECSYKISTKYLDDTGGGGSIQEKVALLSCASTQQLKLSNSYFDTTKNEWVESVPSTRCIQTQLNSIYKFCKRMYPYVNDIANVELIGKQVKFTIEKTCDINDVSCDSTAQEVQADVYKCVYGKYEDKALFVPPNCDYTEMNEDGNKCESQDYWQLKANEFCKNNGKILNSTSMKKWCVGETNIGRYEGIEVVCCSSNEDDNIDDDDEEYDDDESDEESRDDDTVDINDVLSQGSSQDTKAQPQQINKIDLTKNVNEPVDKQQDQVAVIGDDISAIDGNQDELTRYKTQKQNINQEYEDKKRKYVNEWNDARVKINSKDEVKLNSIDDKYNKLLKDVELDHQNLLKQEDDLHENIVQSSINEEKENAKRNFDTELSKYQSTSSTERLLNAFKRLFLAEERDRLHQITVYKRIIDPSSDNERIKTIVKNIKLIDAQLDKCEKEIRTIVGTQIDIKLSGLIDTIKTDYIDIRKESSQLIDSYDKPQQQQPQQPQTVLDNVNIEVVKLSDKQKGGKQQQQDNGQTVNESVETSDDDDDDGYDDYESEENDVDSGEESGEDNNNNKANAAVDQKAPEKAPTPPATAPVVDNNKKVDDDGSIEETEEDDDDDESNEIETNKETNKVDSTNNNNNQNKNTNNNVKDDDDDDDDEDDDDSDESSEETDDGQGPIISEDKPNRKGVNPNYIDDSIKYDPLSKIKNETGSYVIMYLAMGFCGTLFIVLIVIGLVVRRKGTSKYTQLSTPADIYSPEERHVSQMQQHGFVNPTYVALEKQIV